MSKTDKQLTALTTMSSAQLREEWLRAGAAEPPSVSDALLKRLLAHRLQERRHGGLPAAVLRELQRASSKEAETIKPTAEVRPGTRFVREWNSQIISVEALEKGFLWNDRHYPSLSAIAREVTGAHWSGPRFFGVASRG
ncbi:DUF2924 domain-containing protein [Rhizorhabdus wittichii]|uniref:DUF2924 domain-containing protein n=1 Tax=Rhizorhabdus wittichii TaxID=160791 RepID=A0A975HCG2_9SPHN|nr:DUF2924 domain-containing protein [Rhizorhabdus wittichii]QTH20142.1 DUF2924 domain-containing protein [Rhizorhabdus wittichii]QTH20233.1 DUF2924 domain-containing protein [Rhizorhabdus wittichii]